jgi:hypothetical protein
VIKEANPQHLTIPPPTAAKGSRQVRGDYQFFMTYSDVLRFHDCPKVWLFSELAGGLESD